MEWYLVRYLKKKKERKKVQSVFIKQQLNFERSNMCKKVP